MQRGQVSRQSLLAASLQEKEMSGKRQDQVNVCGGMSSEGRQRLPKRAQTQTVKRRDERSNAVPMAKASETPDERVRD